MCSSLPFWGALSSWAPLRGYCRRSSHIEQRLRKTSHRCLRLMRAVGRYRAYLAASLFVAFVPSILLAGTNEIPRLTFSQLVDSIRANSELTQTIKSYSGKEAEIRGFTGPAGPPARQLSMLSPCPAHASACGLTPA